MDTHYTDAELMDILGFEPDAPPAPSVCPTEAAAAAAEDRAASAGPQHAAACFRKLSDAFAACGDGQRIVIQAKPRDDPRGFFYTYDDPEDLDRDAAALRDCRFVREHINKRFQRKAFADIDTRRHNAHVLIHAWAYAWPGTAPPTIYGTTKGSHLIGGDWVTVKEHQRGLAALADMLPGKSVDGGAIHSLRLAGTVDKTGPGRKAEHPAGLPLSATLVQPLNAPLDHEADNRKDRAAMPRVAITDAEIAAGIAVIAEDPASLEIDLAASSGCRINLRRATPGHCLICDRSHDNANAFLIVEPGAAFGWAYCYQTKRGVGFRRPDFPDAPDDAAKRFPGPFTGRLGDSYEQAGGVAAAPAGDYIEGSPCGLGKSKAAWESIDADPAGSVVLISYRKTFTASQGGLHGCESYSDSTADIVMTGGRRVVCQYESLHRIRGTPDTLVIDELHGIRRQACGDLGKSDSWAVLCAMVREAGRVIVLDAYADDDDCALLSDLRGRPIQMVRNLFQPHTDRRVLAFAARRDLQSDFERYALEFSRRPREWRLENRFVVVCQTRADVEETASRLERLGLRVKAYHGKTDMQVRAAEFANHEEAWRDVEIIVHNSTLEAGVSIEDPSWKTAWVLMNGIGHVEAAIQGIHRFRNVKTYYCYAAGRGAGGDFPTTEAGIVAAITAGEKFAAGTLPNQVVRDEPGADNRGEVSAAAYVAKMVRLGDDYTRSTYARLWIANTLEGNRSARYWPARFYAMLASSGFQVTHLEKGATSVATLEGLAAADPELAPAAVRTFTDAPAGRIADAEARVWQEVLERNGGEVPSRNLSAAEIHSRDKVALMNEYHADEGEITADFVESFAPVRVVTAHRATVGLVKTSASTHEAAVEALRRGEAMATGRSKALAPRIATHAERASRSLDGFRALGFTGLEDTRQVPRRDVEAALAANAETVAELYKARGRLWPDIRRPKKSPADLRSHLGAINGVLDTQYGARIVAVNARCERFVINRMEWPDDPIAHWLDPTASPPPALGRVAIRRDADPTREISKEAYEAELAEIIQCFEASPQA